MAYARPDDMPPGDVARPREVQAALADWVEVEPRRWERKMREW